MKILVLGATGMLGNAIFRYLSAYDNLAVKGTVRSAKAISNFSSKWHANLITHVDVLNPNDLHNVFERVKPNLVINCVGVIKQVSFANDVLAVVPINTILPHRILSLCKEYSTRLIHFSTDCVFSGNKGGYLEGGYSDANDLYGRSKFLGEVSDPNSLTIRTSIIGHELSSKLSLVNWFLDQVGPVNGYDRAIFSGLPTVEIARILHKYVINNGNLTGIYHLSSEPINKFELLTIISNVYGKKIDINKSSDYVIDRSLNSDKFRRETGFHPRPWLEMVKSMRDFK